MLGIGENSLDLSEQAIKQHEITTWGDPPCPAVPGASTYRVKAAVGLPHCLVPASPAAQQAGATAYPLKEEGQDDKTIAIACSPKAVPADQHKDSVGCLVHSARSTIVVDETQLKQHRFLVKERRETEECLLCLWHDGRVVRVRVVLTDCAQSVRHNLSLSTASF